MPSDAAEVGGNRSIPEWEALEHVVRRLLEEHAALRERVGAAETRVAELEDALRDVSAGRIDPVAVAEHARSLERENRQLNERLERARHSVQRILGRMRLVEEEP